MSTAEQIIAEHRWSALTDACACGDPTITWGAHPVHVVAALTNAGKTIVELPEADSIDHLAQPRFGSVTAGDGVVSDDEGYEYDPVEARIRAAALLAAARVAEGGDQP
ncbi:hypothetical protein A6411_23825 [Prescottella equi]|uniref:hypothetical protein n=1 Tax=Rhodococcus hoagii TaxID=43767 RepID=UPI0009BDB827|nr:hypothetical protein [Prescottella equi]OQQ23342.1 hypothetical protein A6411_23825 [Prescottella equi]